MADFFRSPTLRAWWPGHFGSGSDPESGQRGSSAGSCGCFPLVSGALERKSESCRIAPTFRAFPGPDLMLKAAREQVYNSPPEAPRSTTRPRKPRRSTNHAPEVYKSPPGGPGGQQIAPGKSTTPPRKPRRSTSHAPEAYKSPPGGPGGQQIAPGRSTTRPRKPRRSTSHAPEVYTSPPEGPGGPQVTPKRRHHPAPASQPPAWSQRPKKARAV